MLGEIIYDVDRRIPKFGLRFYDEEIRNESNASMQISSHKLPTVIALVIGQ